MDNSNIYSIMNKLNTYIINNLTSQQNRHVCLASLELTEKDVSTISKLQNRQTKPVSILKLSEVNITNRRTLKLSSKFVNLKQLHFYQCTFVNPEINLKKYTGLEELILTLTCRSDSLNLKKLRIKSCKGHNIWKFTDSALVEIL
jgi:hypothetical protein